MATHIASDKTRRQLGEVSFSASIGADGQLVIESNSSYVYIGTSSSAGVAVAGETVGLFMSEHIRREKDGGR